MAVEFRINNSTDPKARFVSWSPSACEIRVTDATGAAVPGATVQITGKSSAAGGVLAFRKGTTGAFSNSISLTTNTTGVGGPFFVAGKFGSASATNGDVSIQAIVAGKLAGSLPIMVRIRKNANNLTPAERDRFVAAFAQLNNNGAGRFADFRDMHTAVSSPQAHGAPG